MEMGILLKVVRNSLCHWKQWINTHNNAAGFGIKISNIDRLIDYANSELKNVNFNEGFYEADFVVSGNSSYLEKLIFDLDRGKKLFGQGNKEPVIVVENIVLPPSGYSIIGKNLDTLRFEFNGITYVKFKALDLIEELKEKTGKLIFSVAGCGNINTWGGKSSPQILINEIEFKESSVYDF